MDLQKDFLNMQIAYEKNCAIRCNCSYEELKAQLDRSESLFGTRYLEGSPRHENWLLWVEAWQAAKAQAIPEGFVVVPKENIFCYWQDNDEPENLCSNESDFDCLGDCIDLGEIMEITKFTQAHVNKEILFGTWFAEAIDPSEKANFFVGTHAECMEILAKNKAMIEAQETAK